MHGGEIHAQCHAVVDVVIIAPGQQRITAIALLDESALALDSEPRALLLVFTDRS